LLNWVFLRFPWQWQAFWNSQASKPLIHMPYNISIKFHPMPSTFLCVFFVVSMATVATLKIPKVVCTSRVFNKIVLNRLNWNLKRLHDKRGGGYFFHIHSKWCILRHFKVVYKYMKKKVS
jgi:hypothetical protein